MVRCKVVGPRSVAGVTTGGIVDLDETTVNIPALVKDRHVEVIPAKKTAAKKAGD